MPKVSICVPTLNTRPYLPERFETVFNQTFQDWELVVCDSYSDDGSWEYIQELAAREPRMRISQTPRKGVYAGFNDCIQLARGEYVYIARSDDTMSPDFLEEMVAAFGPQYKPEDHWLANCGIQTVLDVGAHMGEFAQRIRAMLPGADLISFEPLQEPFAKLTERFKGQPNFRAIRCALGEKAGQHEIHHNEYAPSSSLLSMAELHKQSFTFAVKQKTEMIEVRRLSDVVRELNLRDPLLLKLDVQGFEDKVIAGGEDVVARAKIIIIEVSFQPLYEGGPLFDDVYRLLKEHGFTYHGNFEQLFSPKDGRILQADAIFCRQ